LTGHSRPHVKVSGAVAGATARAAALLQWVHAAGCAFWQLALADHGGGHCLA
jgi:hypothetical protein